MPNDMTQQQIDASRYSRQAPQGYMTAEDPLAAIAWWLTGGLVLAAWTGIALVLTGA